MRVANVLTREKMQDVLVHCLQLDDTAVNAPSLDDLGPLSQCTNRERERVWDAGKERK